MQKRGAQQVKKQNEHDREIQKIEQAAMASFEREMITSGKPLSRFFSSSPGSSTSQVKAEDEEEKSVPNIGRFGDEGRADKSKQQALDMITKKLAKKHQWFESKTVEGKTYYYNRVTYGKK